MKDGIILPKPTEKKKKKKSSTEYNPQKKRKSQGKKGGPKTESPDALRGKGDSWRQPHLREKGHLSPKKKKKRST